MKTLLVLLLAGCSAANGAAQGAGNAPHCSHTITITVGGEVTRDGGVEPVAFCHDCHFDLSCLFDRTQAGAEADQHGIETGPIDVSPHTQVRTGVQP